jgi:tetratricopeptide (TPR) repeat protein
VHSLSNVFSNAATGKFIRQGNDYLKKRDYEKARQSYDAAIAQEPTAWGPYMNRAVVLIHQQKWDLALQDLNNVIRLKPGHLTAALMRGQVNTRLGNYGRALAEYDMLVNITASSLTMTSAWALNGRAWIRATCPDASLRNGNQALADAKAACASTACRYAGCTDTLAAAYAEVGDFDSAIRFQKQAIRQAQEEAAAVKDADRRRNAYEKEIALYQTRLAGYERHQPWRSSPKLEDPIVD